MIKSKLLATAFAVAALSFTSAQATPAPTGQEACMVNKTEIMVPKGQCAKIQAGDVSGLTEDLKTEVDAARTAH